MSVSIPRIYSAVNFVMGIVWFYYSRSKVPAFEPVAFWGALLAFVDERKLYQTS
jgi:hypothetical protein